MRKVVYAGFAGLQGFSNSFIRKFENNIYKKSLKTMQTLQGLQLCEVSTLQTRKDSGN